MKRSKTTTCKAFTVPEMLAVVAIIMIIISILLPSLTRARITARRAICGSNLHQIAVAFRQYANENQRYYPMADDKTRGGTYWSLNALYVMSHKQGLALRDYGIATDKPVFDHQADIKEDRVDTAWACPSRPDWPRLFGYQGLLHTDHYQLLTGLKGNGWFFGRDSTYRAGDTAGTVAILSDHIYVYPGSQWLGSHTQDERGLAKGAEGFNQAHADGSVAWIHASRFVVGTAVTPVVKFNSGWPWAWSWYETP